MQCFMLLQPHEIEPEHCLKFVCRVSFADMGRSNTTSFSAGSVRDEDFWDEPYMEPADDREASWLDRQTWDQQMANDGDVNYTNIAVLTPEALREADALRQAEAVRHMDRHPHDSATAAASTTTPPPREDQRPTCDHGGLHAPLTLLPPPETWRPAPRDVLLVTRIWRDTIWVWNESATDSHHGVGIILMRWLIGDYPHWMPAAQKHCIITGHFQDQEESGLPVIQIHAILPSGWPWGRGLLMVRWLEGW